MGSLGLWFGVRASTRWDVPGTERTPPCPLLHTEVYGGVFSTPSSTLFEYRVLVSYFDLFTLALVCARFQVETCDPRLRASPPASRLCCFSALRAEVLRGDRRVPLVSTEGQCEQRVRVSERTFVGRKGDACSHRRPFLQNSSQTCLPTGSGAWLPRVPSLRALSPANTQSCSAGKCDQGHWDRLTADRTFQTDSVLKAETQQAVLVSFVTLLFRVTLFSDVSDLVLRQCILELGLSVDPEGIEETEGEEETGSSSVMDIICSKRFHIFQARDVKPLYEGLTCPDPASNSPPLLRICSTPRHVKNNACDLRPWFKAELSDFRGNKVVHMEQELQYP
ncbi:hypothetical protein E5288_WYG018870 [Bos mutus]|uniref:Uncharacterized protein n=1 Tax=Bos mutus TaxID=72004 RepID=A0A6B0R1R0_9CETA|nr:hypothetical protein [Bos mutus]